MRPLPLLLGLLCTTANAQLDDQTAQCSSSLMCVTPHQLSVNLPSSCSDGTHTARLRPPLTLVVPPQVHLRGAQRCLLLGPNQLRRRVPDGVLRPVRRRVAALRCVPAPLAASAFLRDQNHPYRAIVS
jgi:hypothetical protein